MNRIKEARIAAGLSQKYVAMTLGVSGPSVSNWESGKTTPTADNLQMLSALLGVSIDYLLGRESDPAPAQLPLPVDLGAGETVAQYASPRDEAEDIRAALIAKLLRLNPDQLAMAENYVAFLEHQEAEK